MTGPALDRCGALALNTRALDACFIGPAATIPTAPSIAKRLLIEATAQGHRGDDDHDGKRCRA
jgi:hypothetical protein